MPIYHFLYLILAIIGLGFLVFIHELGHYFVAKRCGMKIQVFSIGFGKPFYSWMRGGVKWQLCFVLLGGYVKIAGMQKEGRVPPHKVKGGFYSKSPKQRIAVAFAGPIVNLVFAFVLFALIWVFGGRQKPFAEYTQLIGAMDVNSALYGDGVKSGDQILSFNDKPFRGVKDLTYTMVEKDLSPISVKGTKIDYLKQEKEPFDLNITPYPDPRYFDRDMYTIGILSPASYLIYDADQAKMPKGAPMLSSGIQSGDRILWVDNKLVFSQIQLSKIINEPILLLSVQRGNQTFITRVPKFKVDQLQAPSFKDEISDWHYALQSKQKLSDLYFIPYQVSSTGRVEATLSYIDDDSQKQPQWKGSPGNQPLRVGDQILAVDGMPISSGPALLNLAQTRHIQVIVKRNAVTKPMPWTQADRYFETSVDWKALTQVIGSLARGEKGAYVDHIVALKPTQAIPYQDFPLPKNQKAKLTDELELRAQEISEIENQQEKEQAEKIFKAYTGRLMLGIPLVDQKVIYNPSPWVLFEDTMSDVWRTLIGLFSGSLSPKWVAGPVGIIQMLHHSWGLGITEALFWLAVISLNLGILNLLPVPPFDGGHIVFSFLEGATGKRISHKVMDRIVLVFVILLIVFALYITFNDVVRLVGKFL